MRTYVLSFLFLLQIFSCRTKSGEKSPAANSKRFENSDSTASDSFFPVTSYLRGQINDIREKGVNPVKYITNEKGVDSVWLKSENFEKEMAPFLETIIDTTNLKTLFSEERFLDQTLNAYTFTYDPKVTLPDSLALQHWDVYIDPKTNKVKRIYMIRNLPGNKQQQLTWQSDKWCKVVTIGSDNNSNNVVENEVLIKWDF